MGETSGEEFHRREALRYGRLSAAARDPLLKAKLAQVALAHARIADALGTERFKPIAKSPAQAQDSRYEIRLICGHGKVTAPIEAETDIDALRICWAVHDACSDVSEKFELWRGPRLIAKSHDGRGVRRPNEIPTLNGKSQESVLATEELLLRSTHAIAQSTRLLEATRRMRDVISARKSFPVAADEQPALPSLEKEPSPSQ
jgi:hypothetical protein